MAQYSSNLIGMPVGGYGAQSTRMSALGQMAGGEPRMLYPGGNPDFDMSSGRIVAPGMARPGMADRRKKLLEEDRRRKLMGGAPIGGSMPSRFDRVTPIGAYAPSSNLAMTPMMPGQSGRTESPSGKISLENDKIAMLRQRLAAMIAQEEKDKYTKRIGTANLIAEAKINSARQGIRQLEKEMLTQQDVMSVRPGAMVTRR